MTNKKDISFKNKKFNNMNKKILSNNDQFELLSLNSAMLNDIKLQQLVQKFELEINENKQIQLVEQIIIRWSDLEDLYIKDKNLYMLKVLKLFHINIKNKNCIKKEYNKLTERIYAQLMKSTHLAEYYSLIITKNVMKYDLSKLVIKLKNEIDINEEQGMQRLYQVYNMIKNLGIIPYSNFYEKDNKNSFCYLFDFESVNR